MTTTGPESPSAALASLRARVASGDWASVVEMLDAQWATLVTESRDDVAAVLAALPEETLAAHPRWRMARAYLDRLSGNGSARTLRVGQPESFADATLLDRLADLTSSSAARRASGKWDRALEAVEEAHRALRLGAVGELDALAVARAELQYQWGMTRELTGDLAGAASEYTASFEFAVATGHDQMRYASAGGLAWVHALSGRRSLAERWLAEIAVEPTDEWWSSRHAVAAVHARALLLTDEFDVDQAAAEIDRVDPSSSPERWAADVFVRAILVTRSRDARRQLTRIDELVSSLPTAASTSGANAALVMVARATLFLDLELVDAAVSALASTPESAGSSVALVAVARATVALVSGDAATAASESDRVVASGATDPRTVAAALMLGATAAVDATTDGDAASGLARQAIEIAAEHGLLRALCVAPAESIAPLLSTDGILDLPTIERVLAHAPERASASAFARLSPRERAVVAEVVRSNGVQEIARALYVSPNTVKSQLRSVYRKVGVRSREQLRVAAMRNGFGG